MNKEEILNHFRDFYESCGLNLDNFEPNGRPGSTKDISAILLLEKLSPKKYRYSMIASAEHDIIYFDVSVDDLCESENLTKEDIEHLVKCGVHIEDCENLAMFV